MDIVKIKTWIKTFAKQKKIWFESYDEIPDIPIEDMHICMATLGFFNRKKSF